MYRRSEDGERKEGKEGISLMFLAADQLRSQGYPGFANSHGKGALLRAGGGLEGGGGPGLKVEHGRERWLPFFVRRKAEALGESNPPGPVV